MPKPTRVIQRTITPQVMDDAVIFSALKLESGVRIFGNADLQIDALQFIDLHKWQATALRARAGCIIYGTTDKESIGLKYGSFASKVALSSPELNHLAGLNCILTVCNHALGTDHPEIDPAYLKNWVTHHTNTHSVDALVLINRLGPDGAGHDFASVLSQRLTGTLRSLVVVNIPVATGDPQTAPADHLIHAPHAPGKARMSLPASDAWRAPLRDEVLLEFARTAFLNRANGVVYLDPSDWLGPSDISIFDQARNAAPDHVIALKGHYAYPWQTPAIGPAVPGDHICRPFDVINGFTRWVTCPARNQESPQTWRPHRIIGLSARTAMSQPLWRFMSLRHPHASPAQLVAKASLKEDSNLVNFAQKTLKHHPARIPQPTLRHIGHVLAKERGDNVVVVTAMKNEGPFILEWIAFHRAIGVRKFVVFSNDCSDGTDALLDRLAEANIVEHYRNPYRKLRMKPQYAAFRAAEELPTVKNADWLMTLDVDEFINVHVGQGHLHDLFAEIDDANMISCTWRLFGNGDRESYTSELVLDQFTHCAAKDAAKPHQAWGFKTLFQNNGVFQKLGVHRPKGMFGAAVDEVRWVNGSGKPMPRRQYRLAWRSDQRTIGYDLVTLNHYAVRSAESFLVKRDRGRVNHVDRDQGAAYWFRMNHNTEKDTSIQRKISDVESHLELMLSNPAIADAHNFCIAQHRQKIAALLSESKNQAFFDAITSARSRALSRMLPAFGSNVFLAGPDCVPQDLIDQYDGEEIPNDLYFTVPRPEKTNH